MTWKCRLFGHDWLTLKMEDTETACFRIAWKGILNRSPELAQLYCKRCGEWITVEMKTFKWYLTRYPFPEEYEDEEPAGIVVVDPSGGCDCGNH